MNLKLSNSILAAVLMVSLVSPSVSHARWIANLWVSPHKNCNVYLSNWNSGGRAYSNLKIACTVSTGSLGGLHSFGGGNYSGEASDYIDYRGAKVAERTLNVSCGANEWVHNYMDIGVAFRRNSEYAGRAYSKRNSHWCKR